MTTPLRRWFPALAASACLATLPALSGCSKGANAHTSTDAAPAMDSQKRIVRVDPAALQRLGISVEPAGSKAPGHRLHIPGTLDFSYTQYAEIGPLVEGRVTKISVGVGDRVKKGQVLATLLVPALARSQADLVAANAAAHVAREHASREAALLEKSLTTAREAETARGEQIRTDAEVAAARARLEAIGAGMPKGATSMVGGAGRLPLVATIPGLVVRREAVLGRFLEPNQTAFIIADISELWAILQVHESDLPYMEVGADVDLLLDAYPGQVFKGKLALVEPQVGRASRSASARVVVPNPDEKLRPGLFVRAAVALPDTEGTERFLIPSDATQTLGTADVVFVELAPGEFEVREIKTSRRTAEVTEVAAGLQRGERIAVTGSFLLRGEVIKQ
jgi:cobalt-zinc-cadmium efflux system membrane fusion protein